MLLLRLLPLRRVLLLLLLLLLALLLLLLLVEAGGRQPGAGRACPDAGPRGGTGAAAARSWGCGSPGRAEVWGARKWKGVLSVRGKGT